MSDCTALRIYTDGGYRHSKNIGGWAFIVSSPRGVPARGKGSGHFVGTTNNRMELFAAIKAIEFANQKFDGVNVCIVTDSKYVIHCATADLSVTKLNSPANAYLVRRNRDLIARLQYALNTGLAVTFEWIKGHSGDMWNTTADRLASRAMARAIGLLSPKPCTTLAKHTK